MIWTRSRALRGALWSFERDVLPDVPRPTLSRDEPPFVPVEERPVPRNMNISQDILKKFGYTPGCATCRKLSRNEYFHPGLAHCQDCRAASRTDPVYRDRAERAEQGMIDIYAKEVERIDHPRKASLEPNVMPEPPTQEKEGEGQPSARDTKRARGTPEQDLSGEIPIPSADETLTSPEIQGVFQFDSAKFDSNSDLFWSFFKQWRAAYIQWEYRAAEFPSCLVRQRCERAHGESIVTDEEEQAGTRALISTLIVRLHGVDVAEDSEISSGDGMTDEWLSSWYPETHVSQKNGA